MTCSDVQRVLPELLDDAPDRVFQADFETHLKSCLDCSDLVSDLKLITSEARQLAETEEPAPRVWVRIAAELRAEGLIRDPEPGPGRPVLVTTSSRRRWSAWWLAPVAAALLAAGSYVVSHKAAPQIAAQPAAAVPAATPVPAVSPVPEAVVATAPVPAPPFQHPVRQDVNRQETNPAVATSRDVEPGPNTEDQQFLSVVSTLGPSTRASYENQLQAVNNDIRETQAYVDRYPGDVDARQHLMDAYQQKALLYQIALDRIQ
jgi:hypothetical protein